MKYLLKKLEAKFRYYVPKHLKSKNKYIKAIKGLKGIEIGGPSFTFSNKGLLPVYESIKNLDGCNFSTNTVWEGSLVAGETYHYCKNRKPGIQFIAEGNDLPQIPDNTYDFVLSCHNLEHFANPLKALQEWKRITKPDGYLILVLPDKHKTFDHKRTTTKITHLIEDLKNNTTEDDTTHFPEVIANHDIEMDAGVASVEDLKKRTIDNINNRCVHHHVFDKQLVIEILELMNYEVSSIDLLQINIFSLGKNIK